MGRAKAILAAESLQTAHKFQALLADLDVEVALDAPTRFKSLVARNSDCDLAILELRAGSADALARVEELLVELTHAALLLVVDVRSLDDLRLPVRVPADFVVRSASVEECSARVRQLLWPGSESAASDYVTVDDMTVNLATYQVKVNGEPLDLTYLEYSLLAFLVTHPGRTYSRDVLLSRVWGFDYYGGSRTVDVHVRRVRAKLGPELAQHLETVRGVGYLWSM